MMLARWRESRSLSLLSHARASNGKARNTVADRANVDPDLARRFRDAALPHMDALYSLARYLLRNPDDAEDAVQETYLRSLRHFDSFQGPAIKPWLMAILRNVCRAEYGRRATAHDGDGEVAESALPLWQEPQQPPDAEMLARKDAESVRNLLALLPEAFREVLVLREVDDLSYRDIAKVIDAPVGTVMSRLARARAMLRDAWLAADKGERLT
jgi:RNA polymerase sigma-70 factor (ECF subfamily)